MIAEVFFSVSGFRKVATKLHSPLPNIDDVVSHPDQAWRKRRSSLISSMLGLGSFDAPGFVEAFLNEVNVIMNIRLPMMQ